ncbi:MAG: hypothetical protein ABMA00_21455, partial [Gemmatimonas sp.]
ALSFPTRCKVTQLRVAGPMPVESPPDATGRRTRPATTRADSTLCARAAGTGGCAAMAGEQIAQAHAASDARTNHLTG